MTSASPAARMTHQGVNQVLTKQAQLLLQDLRTPRVLFGSTLCGGLPKKLLFGLSLRAPPPFLLCRLLRRLLQRALLILRRSCSLCCSLLLLLKLSSQFVIAPLLFGEELVLTLSSEACCLRLLRRSLLCSGISGLPLGFSPLFAVLLPDQWLIVAPVPLVYKLALVARHFALAVPQALDPITFVHAAIHVHFPTPSPYVVLLEFHPCTRRHTGI